MSKKILFFSNQGLSPLHLSIELEVLSSLKNNPENEIISLTCNAALSGCFFNPTKNVLACSLCESRTQTYHKLIGDIEKRALPKISTKKEKIGQFGSLDELESLRYGGINIGRGIASSLITISRNYDIYKPEHQQKVNALYDIAIESYGSLTKTLQEYKPDVVYFFNGRFTETHVLRELCIKENIDYVTFEVASSGKYLVFENALPHSMVARKKLIQDMWHSTDKTIRNEKAHQFYIQKRNGTFKARFNHTSEQEKNNLPDNWDFSMKNIVFFNSSEDEMKTIKEWKHDIFTSQNQAIQTIVKHYSDNENFQFYLRVHPNLGTVENSQMKELDSFKYDNLTIIGPKEKADSYALASQADIVISFGSTIGIESAYWGTPSIMFGRSFYENLDATYNPSSFEELYKLLENENLQAKPQENTLIYGYYVANFGTPFKRVKYNGKDQTFFDNVKLKKWNFNLLFYLFRYSKYIGTWKSLTKVFTNRPLKLSNITKLLHQIPK